jgi:hypothetical protein
MTFFLFPKLNDDAFDPKGPFKPVQRLDPQLSILLFGAHHRARRHLTLSPDPQHAGMSKIDSPLPVQCVEAFHHVIRIARTGYCTFIGSKPCSFTPSDKRCHRPKPGMFGRAECLGRRTTVRLNTDSEDGLAGNVGHEGHFRSIHSGGGCASLCNHRLHAIASKMVDFPISFGTNS